MYNVLSFVQNGKICHNPRNEVKMSKFIAGILAALVVWGIVTLANDFGASLPVATCTVVAGLAVGLIVG